MSAEPKRSSVVGVKEETTSGTLEVLDNAAQFIPVRPGTAINAAVETADSDELTGDIEAAQSLVVKETPSGTHSAYLKHSEVEGTAPEVAPLYKSAFGSQTDYGTEYDTVAGSTTAIVNVDTGEGATNPVGKALLLKDGTNGYSIRNVASVSTDALTLNYLLSSAPASGVDLGKPNTFYPVATGHPSYSVWNYGANGALIEAIAGCRTSSIAYTMNAASQAEVEFAFEGSKAFFNPITITSANKYIDITDDGGTIVVTLAEKSYKTPIALADEIATKCTAASVGSGDDAITCTYSSTTGKYTLASDGATFSLLWKTGTHGSDNADDHVGTTIGFSDVADDTGAVTYTADSVLSFAAGFTPTYDDATNVVVKQAELFIGTASDNVCRKASALSFTLGTPTEEVLSICADTGVAERIIVSREATMTATILAEKYEVGLYDKFINNTATQVMANIGPKDGSGNWVPGKCINVYMGNASITAMPVGGESYLQFELSAKGFASSTKKGLYLNFI